jgi:hypothetical protein
VQAEEQGGFVWLLRCWMLAIEVMVLCTEAWCSVITQVTAGIDQSATAAAFFKRQQMAGFSIAWLSLLPVLVAGQTTAMDISRPGLGLILRVQASLQA